MCSRDVQVSPPVGYLFRAFAHFSSCLLIVGFQVSLHLLDTGFCQMYVLQIFSVCGLSFHSGDSVVCRADIVCFDAVQAIHRLLRGSHLCLTQRVFTEPKVVPTCSVLSPRNFIALPFTLGL